MRGKKSFAKLIAAVLTTVFITCGFNKFAPEIAHAATPDFSEQISSLPVGDHPGVPAKDAEEAFDSDYSEKRLLKRASAVTVDHGYYYERLDSDIKKDLYDGMYIAADSSRRLAYGSSLPSRNSETAVAAVAYKFYTGTSSRIAYYTGSTPLCTEIVNEAIEALCYDHMENVEYYMCEAEVYEFKNGSTYKDYILMRPYTKDNYEQMNSQITAKAKNYADQMRSSGLVNSSNPAQTVLNAHDFFISRVSFNYPVSYNSGNSGYYNNAHTAYGALCEGSAVCDGYATGYALLLKELGIEAKVVTGAVYASGSVGGHAWSMVKLDGEWYEEDTTWDDTNDVITHIFYNKTTDQYSSGINGYKHIRVHPYTGILIDKAYGSRYAYRENNYSEDESGNSAEVKENSASVEAEGSADGSASDRTYLTGGVEYRLSSDGGAVLSSGSSFNERKIIIPDNIVINGNKYPVTEIAEEAFAGCTKVKEIKLGRNVEIIGNGAFKNCKNLTTIDMSASKVTKIGSRATAGCKKLSSVKVNGNYLKKLGSKAFRNSAKKVKVVVYAKNKRIFNSVVKKLKTAGLKTGTFKYKKKK
ncbi:MULTISPECIES: leucine-rich repeat protein [unclassified Butyrivibrio]|uniref:leucine-rich repeat protein n=1 Tax=unclassified Butyrivibrio TaxID=2639466 RepID=UPI000403023F|nr:MULTISPECIES: leucine-rich repeat protein [unclassified Butyrivibrio]